MFKVNSDSGGIIINEIKYSEDEICCNQWHVETKGCKHRVKHLTFH